MSNSIFKNILFFLYGFISLIKINIFGQIYLVEILSLILFLPIIFLRKISKDELFIILPCVLWAFIQLISDMVNSIDLGDSLKGVFSPLVFCSTIIVNYFLLKRNYFYQIYYILGFSIYSALIVLIKPTDYQLINFWKFGFGLALLNIILLFFYRSEISGEKNLKFILFIIFFGILSFYFDSRSIAFFALFGGFLYILARKKNFNNFSRFSLLKISFPIVVMVIFINYLAFIIFSSNIVDGLLPEEAETKFKKQATSEVGLLLAGRSESLIAVQAILDAPFLGHGSWAKDKTGEYNAEYNKIRYSLGVIENINSTEKEYIPSHSFIFGSAVWFGFTGIIVWLYILNYILKKYFLYIRYLPLYFHVGVIIFVWNVFFSPFGAENRIYTAIFISVFFAYTFICEKYFLNTRRLN